MCVAVPGRIVSVDADTRSALVAFGSRERMIDLTMTPHAVEGDWVVTHSGFAVRVLAAAEAAETMRVLASIPTAPDGIGGRPDEL